MLLVIVLICLFMPMGENFEGEHKQAIFLQPNQAKQSDVLKNRFPPPSGYNQIHNDSFSIFLRNLPLLPEKSPIKLYNGQNSSRNFHEAVVDLPIGNKDLHQCADAILHIRSLYFYQKSQFDSIKFRLTNGFLFDYLTWTKGFRIQVKGNKVSWIKKHEPKNDLRTFYAYLEVLYTYAGTASLGKELKKAKPSAIKPGDVIINPGYPGHAVLVVDVAVNKNGQKMILIGQSYMPAQQFHILKPSSGSTSSNPWFSWPEQGDFQTPEWSFHTQDLCSWQ